MSLLPVLCAGWCIWIFIIIAGAMLFAINTHLVAAARLTAKGEGATLQQLPWAIRLLAGHLLLPALKFLLFFVSFVFSNALFFSTQFGSRSCFFSTYGFQGYPVPWWVSACLPQRLRGSKQCDCGKSEPCCQPWPAAWT